MIIQSVSQAPSRIPSPISFIKHDSSSTFEGGSEKSLVEVSQEIPANFWSTLKTPFMPCLLACFPKSASKVVEFDESKLPMRSNNYINASEVTLTPEVVAPSIRGDIIPSPLPPEVDKEMQQCQEKIDGIVNNSDLTEEEVASEIKATLNSFRNVGFYFNAANYQNENYSRNCKIALRTIAEQENIGGLRINAAHVLFNTFNKSEVINSLKAIFAKNKEINWVDLSFRRAMPMIDDSSFLVELGEVLSGKTIANLDLSGNITCDFPCLTRTMDIISNYLSTTKISMLRLDDPDRRGMAADPELRVLAERLKGADDLQFLTLRNYRFPKTSVDIIVNVLGKTSIKILDVSGNSLEDGEKNGLTKRGVRNQNGELVKFIL